MSRIIHSQNNPQHTKPQKLSTDSIVEKAGYVSAGKRIENLIIAGMRLQLARREQFDTTDPRHEPTLVPTRKLNYDMADASQDRIRIANRLMEQAAEAKRKKEAEQAKIKAEKASGSPAKGSETKGEG